MRSHSSTLGLSLTVLLLACSSPSPTSAPAPIDVDAGAGDAGPLLDAGEPLPPPPPFGIEEEAESPCTATTTAQPSPVTTDATVLADLQTSGDRLVARKLSGAGFMTFDATGGDVTEATLGSDTRVAASPSRIVAAGLDDVSSTLLVRPFDARGAALGAPQALGPVRTGRSFALARGARSVESTIAVWVSPPSELRARVLDEAAHAAGPISLEDGAEFDDLTVVAAPSPSTNDASDFLVVWALRRLALSAHRVYAALVSKDGVVGLPRIVFGSDVRVTLAGLVSRPGSATLLANRDGEPMVVPLDMLGRAAGPARAFHGARDPNVGGGQGIAFGHDRIAIVAAHASGSHAFRLLDAAAKPDGGWVCLDAPNPDGFQLGSLVATPSGFTALVATATRTAVLALDASGTKGP